MRGKIIRGVGGFYYVYAEDGKIYECRAKGIFRKEKVKPLVGDDVEMSVLHVQDREGNVDRLLPRRSMLVRPAAANVDQALVVFAIASPKPNLNLLDRFLILMNRREIPVIICFNKTDLAGDPAALLAIYEKCGCRVCFASVERSEGLTELRSLLAGKTTVLAGPSGVGKSSLTNALLSGSYMEVGAVSRRIDRGRHTTRHTELLVLPGGEAGQPDGYLLDTPGFSSLYLQEVEYEELKDCFEEFAPYEADCRFQGCMHLKEPDCAVKAAVDAGEISASRYESYAVLAEELKSRKKY